MTPTAPIPASIATACAAHDRHRLDVLDALLDEAAPSAVRELLGAALDLCASLRAERDELRAKLDAAPKVCAIHSYEHGPGPCMTCGAWPPGTRELIAACRTRIAGLEQAADERSRTPCNGSCDIALASRQVGPDGIVPRNARECAELWEREAARLWREETRLTARVAELEARPVNARAALISVLTATKHGPGGRGGPGDCDADCVKCEAERALASLGAPPTSRDTVRDAMERAAERFGGPDGVFSGAGFSNALMHAAGLSGAVDGRLVRAILAGRCDVQDRGNGHYQIAPSPTSPPAARPVFAGVSEGDLALEYGRAGYGVPGILAVLARLEVSLVAPVDPEAVARAYHNHAGASAPEWDEVPDWIGTDNATENTIAAMRTVLTAAGIPVTPERK